jgi:hypothetical protein
LWQQPLGRPELFLALFFAIPRTLDPASRAVVATATVQAGPAAASQAVLLANTNLERISDWLTTLLIGATLVQIKDIVSWIGGLGGKLLSNGVLTNDAVVPVIVVYFFVLSFLGVYLITRLYLTFAFRQTLALLTGSDRTPVSMSDLRNKLEVALKVSTAEAFSDALTTFASSASRSGGKDDPRVNANLARILAKIIAGGESIGVLSDNVTALRRAVSAAATDPVIKSQLRAEVASGELTTGDKSLDSEITSTLR